MGLLNPNWFGMAKTVARGPNSTEPTDPQYQRSFDVVPGSLERPTDDLIIGSYEPAGGAARVRVPANVRMSGDTVFVDRALLPEPAVGALKPVAWAAEHRSIAPTSFPRDALTIRNGRARYPKCGYTGRLRRRNHPRTSGSSPWSNKRCLAG